MTAVQIPRGVEPDTIKAIPPKNKITLIKGTAGWDKVRMISC